MTMRSVQCRRTFARCEDGAPPAVRLTRHHHPVELEATHEEPVPAVAGQQRGGTASSRPN